MEADSIFTKTIHTLGRALDLRSMKHGLIASNIANMETPGYKPFDLAVNKALGTERQGSGGVGLVATSPGHFKSPPAPEHRAVVRQSAGGGEKGDGNAVDIDREMSALAENSLMYSVLTRTLSRKFTAIKTAISGGSQR